MGEGVSDSETGADCSLVPIPGPPEGSDYQPLMTTDAPTRLSAAAGVDNVMVSEPPVTVTLPDPRAVPPVPLTVTAAVLLTQGAAIPEGHRGAHQDWRRTRRPLQRRLFGFRVAQLELWKQPFGAFRTGRWPARPPREAVPRGWRTSWPEGGWAARRPGRCRLRLVEAGVVLGTLPLGVIARLRSLATAYEPGQCPQSSCHRIGEDPWFPLHDPEPHGHHGRAADVRQRCGRDAHGTQVPARSTMAVVDARRRA